MSLSTMNIFLTHGRQISLALALTFLTCSLAAAESASKDIPESVGNSLYQRAKQQPASTADRLKLNAEILAEARKCLADHPEVPKTAPLREVLVRRIMLPAAERMYAASPTGENRHQLQQLARDVVEVPVYEGHLIVPEKVRAAETLARLQIYSTPGSKPQEAARHIRTLIAAFPLNLGATNAAEFHGQALVYATQLACETGEKALADEFCQAISQQFLATKGALDALARAGHPAVFQCEMTTLDGRKLRFPDDAKGKVVVLDFWATWCAPCKASMPHLKQIWEKYQDRGVMVVGISCDAPARGETPELNRGKVEKFVTENGYTWTHTYAGEWPKAAVKYGVASIPTVFLLDQNGRILTASAGGREDALIEETLARSKVTAGHSQTSQ